MSPAVVPPWLVLRRFRDSRDAGKYSLAGLLFLIFFEYYFSHVSDMYLSESLVNMKGWGFGLLFDSNPGLLLSLGD